MAHFTRAQWRARPARTGGNPVTNGPQGVAVHYNGPKMGIRPTDPCRCDASVRQIQSFHMDTRGWTDIAYDVVACPHGNTYQGRIGTSNGTGANGTREANRGFMAVMALIGDGESVSPGLLSAIRSGIRLCRQAGAGKRITGHRDHQSTACPGDPLYKLVQNGALEPTPTPQPAPPPKDDTMAALTVKNPLTGDQWPLATALWSIWHYSIRAVSVAIEARELARAAAERADLSPAELDAIAARIRAEIDEALAQRPPG